MKGLLWSLVAPGLASAAWNAFNAGPCTTRMIVTFSGSAHAVVVIADVAKDEADFIEVGEMIGDLGRFVAWPLSAD